MRRIDRVVVFYALLLKLFGVPELAGISLAQLAAFQARQVVFQAAVSSVAIILTSEGQHSHATATVL